MDSQPRSTEALKREVSAEDGGSLLAIMRGLWPFIWPADRPDLQRRVGFSMLLLLVAKLATMAVPFTFKWATDALTGEGTAPVAPSSWLLWVFAAPVAMTIAYGGTRILMALLTQARDGIFAKVAMNAVLDQLPNLRLDDEFEPPFVQGTAFRSPPALHVRFG